MNQCWIIIGKVMWHSPKGNGITNAHDDAVENDMIKIETSPPGDNALTIKQ